MPIVARMQIVMGSSSSSPPPLIRRSLFSSNRSPQTIELGQSYGRPDFRPVPSVACLCRVSIHARVNRCKVSSRCFFANVSLLPANRSFKPIEIFSPYAKHVFFTSARSLPTICGPLLPDRAVTPVYIFIFPSELREFTSFPSSLISAITRPPSSFPSRFHYPRITQEPRGK